MAYIPPFKRAGFPTPRGPSLNKIPGSRHSKFVIQSPQLLKQVMIEQWKNYEDNDGSMLVDFVPAKFSESYTFMAGTSLYVPAAAKVPAVNTQAPPRLRETGADFSCRSSITSSDDFASALDESLASIPDSIPSEDKKQVLKRAVLKTVKTRISPCLTKALTVVQTKAADVKPNTELGVKLVVRFGTLLLYSPSPTSRRLEHLNPVRASLLERQLCGEKTMTERVFRSMETSLLEPMFEQIQQVADSDGHCRTPSTEKYSIQVIDKQQSDLLLKMTCVRVDKKEHAEARTGSPQLKIIKVKLLSERLCNLDVCPLGYETNFRVLLETQVSYVKLEEDVRAGLQDIVDKAILDPSVWGGLRWPSGSVKLPDRDGEGRFVVRGVRQLENGYVYRNNERRWKLRTVNGVDFDHSPGWKIKEVEVAPVRWKRLLKTKFRYNPSPSKDKDDEAGAGSGVVSSSKETGSWRIEDIVEELPGLVEWLAEHIP